MAPLSNKGRRLVGGMLLGAWLLASLLRRVEFPLEEEEGGAADSELRPMPAPAPLRSAANGGARCPTDCQHGGTCLNARCHCPTGFDGEACEHSLPPPKPDCAAPRRKVDPGASTRAKEAAAAAPPPPPRCRPGFLIIGAGKSGTSSLYYYLAAHPAVRPATQKQLQFFDHGYPTGPRTAGSVRDALETYYSSGFPHELSRGQMTGEASPGYMVYSEVPGRIKSALPDVRILAAVRDPVSRAFSSYKYNYLRHLQPGVDPIPFGVMVRWEIDRVLNPCLADAGYAKGGALPRIDITRDCYNKYPVAAQYAEVLDRSNVRWQPSSLPQRQQFVYRGAVGRGLYALMLKHYYSNFPQGQVRLVCTEALSEPKRAAETMRGVGRWLGLGAGLSEDQGGGYDFVEAVGVGRYNTGDATGYETVTPWASESGDEVDPEEERTGAHVPKLGARPGGGGHNAALIAAVSIDEGTEKMLGAFFRPFNEALLKMSGGEPCDWQR